MIRQPLFRALHRILLGVLLISTTIAAAQTGFDIYRFPKGGHRGFGPQAGLVADSEGNLYGTTQYGGTGNCTNFYTKAWTGCGTVFKLTPPSVSDGAWSQTVLYSFQNGDDGAYPNAGVIFDAQGRLYGTTAAGGPYLGGIVFQLTLSRGSDSWIESILYDNPNNILDSQACCSSGNLTFDSKGNLFGTVGFFNYADGDGAGCVTVSECFGVFELSPSASGSWITTYLPNKYDDGLGPTGGLVVDGSGNLFGLTSGGGFGGIGQCYDYGCGTVFELSPPNSSDGEWSGSELHAFDDGTGDGLIPNGALIADRNGNLYGTTQWGGVGPCEGFGGAAQCGTVFELSPSQGGGWTENILYNFQGGLDGSLPSGTLAIDDQGNLYGTTGEGGLGNCSYPYYIDVSGCGIVFKLTKPAPGGSWTKTTLATFNGGNGQFPIGQLLFVNGSLYGTTIAGGQKCPVGQQGGLNPTCGTVFKLTP